MQSGQDASGFEGGSAVSSRILFKDLIEGWLVIEGHVGTEDFVSRQSG
tara:strand:- start:213 stop:356 length:144 start_codon:yes stop_codon:yes gene_type:complete